MQLYHKSTFDQNVPRFKDRLSELWWLMIKLVVASAYSPTVLY